MISASIVLYENNLNELKKIINCLVNSKGVELYKIYLIDNSNDNSLEIIKNFNSKIKYQFNNKNLGYGKAHNIAMNDSIKKNVKYHLVLNSDISFNKNVLSEIVSFMDSDESIGHLMPKIIYPDGSVQYLCKLIPTPLDLIIRLFFPRIFFKKKRHNFELRFTNYEKIMEVPYLSGCFMFLRNSALKKVGLFDDNFFMYPEDIDLTRRINENYKTIFYPHSEVVHQHAKESFKNYKLLISHIINIFKYFNKWGWFFDSKRKNTNNRIYTELKTIN